MELKLHKKYSRASCLLECQIDYVVMALGKKACVPWYCVYTYIIQLCKKKIRSTRSCTTPFTLHRYLPNGDNSGVGLCDPWDAVNYRRKLEAMTEECEHCL